MNTTKFNTLLLFVSVMLTGYASSQQEMIQADKFQLSETQESEIIIDDIINPHYNVDPFKALIYPNPSLTGKVKMSWMDDQNVDQVILIRDTWDGIIEISVKNENEIIVDSLEDGKYYVQFFSNQKLLTTSFNA